MKDLLFALRSGFGFLTAIPVGISMEGIEALMRHVYLFPVIGAALGLIFAISARILAEIAPSSVVAVLMLVLIYKLCGINHADGLADFGDGVTAHTTVEKKVNAMKDVYIGTGGVVFVAIMLLSVFAAISALPLATIPLALIVAEVSAKQSMITFAAFSDPLHKGFGQIAIENTTKFDFLIGLIIAVLICGVVMGTLGLIVLIASLASAVYLVQVSKRNFGGATGDGIGATNEIGRAVALIVSLLLLGFLPSESLWEVLVWTPW
ncbi:MAG: adenosylcobinamide-GDP ribazoletransferase [Methanotrichaceae archaeon]